MVPGSRSPHGATATDRANNTVNRHILVLGATGNPGSRVASKLSEQGVSVRTAARGGADIHFDWNNQATFEGALQGGNEGAPRLACDARRLRWRGRIGRAHA